MGGEEEGEEKAHAEDELLKELETLNAISEDPPAYIEFDEFALLLVPLGVSDRSQQDFRALWIEVDVERHGSVNPDRFMRWWWKHHKKLAPDGPVAFGRAQVSAQ